MEEIRTRHAAFKALCWYLSIHFPRVRKEQWSRRGRQVGGHHEMVARKSKGWNMGVGCGIGIGVGRQHEQALQVKTLCERTKALCPCPTLKPKCAPSHHIGPTLKGCKVQIIKRNYSESILENDLKGFKKIKTCWTKRIRKLVTDIGTIYPWL